MLQFFFLMLRIPQELQQLADHLLEHDGIIGQWTRQVEKGIGLGRACVRAHALLVR
jgi:hypothetical protein